ncbi:hypothetical protein L9F63_026025 [Diploptera punctata]|uniref:Uncharacterized protein n=1 Tax=Diploptera punctata TaxID=6984 RepID=A0AAD7Z5L5_DIPPU|nr:hypothetical protein L9F63_026025 [Diploptera punctata]
MIHLEDVERELAKWRGEIMINKSSTNSSSSSSSSSSNSRESTGQQKRTYESFDLSPKRLCVARKSTTLSPRLKFHSVARKSTNPLPWQSLKKGVESSVESGDTSPPSSRSESPVNLREYSFMVVDLHLLINIA